jgi:Mrp family chromosome partitioning ATPase
MCDSILTLFVELFNNIKSVCLLSKFIIMTHLQHQCHALGQIAETKRILLAAEHVLNHKSPVVLLTTSALHSEGKSLATAALAVTALHIGHRPVLALDLNWYQPTLHHFFGGVMSHPVESFINQNVTAVAQATEYPGLDLVAAPVDHATHSRLSISVFELSQRLITQAIEAYQVVLIDSAAVFPTNRMMMDPVMLASLVDGTMLITRGTVTPRQMVKKAYKVLEIGGAKVIGVIANHGITPTKQKNARSADNG